MWVAKPVATMMLKQHIRYPVMSLKPPCVWPQCFCSHGPFCLEFPLLRPLPWPSYCISSRRVSTNHPELSPVFPHLWNLSMCFLADLCLFPQYHVHKAVEKLQHFTALICTHIHLPLLNCGDCPVHLFILVIPSKVTDTYYVLNKWWLTKLSNLNPVLYFLSGNWSQCLPSLKSGYWKILGQNYSCKSVSLGVGVETTNSIAKIENKQTVIYKLKRTVVTKSHDNIKTICSFARHPSLNKKHSKYTCAHILIVRSSACSWTSWYGHSQLCYILEQQAALLQLGPVSQDRISDNLEFELGIICP